MEKANIILKMLTFHGQIKPDRPEENKLVLEVWAEDLQPYTAEEILGAWRETRRRAKFFSLAELFQDLDGGRRSFLEAAADEQMRVGMNLIIGGGSTDKITDDVTRYVMENVETWQVWRTRTEEDFRQWFPQRFKKAYLEHATPHGIKRVRDWLEGKAAPQIGSANGKIAQKLMGELKA